MNTSIGEDIPVGLVERYMHTLVNHVFKALPMRECEDDTLEVYLKSLQVELIGFRDFVCAVQEDADYLSLLSIVQYMRDHPNCPVGKFRSEVFHAISIIKRLEQRYTAEVSE